ncbi:xanthine dehydrogenase family protein molybdopterin-binding subunit [Streptacidiphilus monticola]|uniref:Xanthine dehydrogenase family protein molybdopterin-binding subunit n=1 Tax=Streptacidiphilus monticola TaxID=2161674 RepID=A0ABW1FTD4_9ACTN
MTREPVLGTPVPRLEAETKTHGTARYAGDVLPEHLAFAWPVPATVALGRVAGIDADDAARAPGVLAVLTHENAPRLHPGEDGTLDVLQSPAVPHRGWPAALVVADTLDNAREAAALLRVRYEPETAELLTGPQDPRAYRPEQANGGHEADLDTGDFAEAFAAAPVRLDLTYRIPALHNHPMEPHTSTALWQENGDLVVYDSNQGSTTVRDTLADLFGLEPGQVRVITQHVGGGFGSKGTPRPQAVLAAMAAKVVGRPVRLALPRGQMAALVGHRAASVQRVRLGADPGGRLLALAHDAFNSTSTVREFAEQSAVPARVMYAVGNLRTTHRVAALPIPSPSWMRAPGECPGMFALESAMDELACSCGVDPIELRVRNEPTVEPGSGRPFAARSLTECLREGARRFDWDRREPAPRSRREGRLLLGTGVAASTYPLLLVPSRAEVQAVAGGFEVRVNATDIGTGARTVLAQIAADALDVPLESVRIRIGDSALPPAPVAGGSAGTNAWGWAVHDAARALRRQLADGGPDLAAADTGAAVADAPDLARHAFGAQFAEVAVDRDTGEVRLRRLLGVFAVGRVLNPRTARSQLAGGMAMGASMALMEGSPLDAAFGDFTARDLAAYHVAGYADLPRMEVAWLDETEPHATPMGSKGIGEIGIVGTAAAVANAVHHATGVRVRDLPLHVERLLQPWHSEDPR